MRRPLSLVARASAVRARCAATLAAALLVGGCASPTTGRVRDAHLLWSRDAASRQIVSVHQAGPFYERVETADGATRSSFRPFLRTKLEAPAQEASHLEVLWPLYSRETRGRESAWRFLVFFGMDKDHDGDVSPENAKSGRSPQDRTWLFPFWFSGTARDGSEYAALFPIAGTIREMYWERIRFGLFPIWCDWDRAGHHTWSVLWPFVQRQTGGGRDAWRILPFWGRTRVVGKMESNFVLWPIWTSARHFDVNPGSDWMLWPLAGSVDRANESATLVLPPLFHFAHGRGKLPDYRKINAPWPLVMVRDEKDRHARWYFPFWMHRWTTDGNADNLTVLWPFWNQRRLDTPGASIHEWSLFPLLHSSRTVRGAGKDASLAERYFRAWPLWSVREDSENRFVKIPDFSFRRRAGQLERNFLGMFTLYTAGQSRDAASGQVRTDREALWGLWRRGRDDAGTYRLDRFWPFWERREENGARRWSVLGGLFGRESPDADTPSRWRFFF